VWCVHLDERIQNVGFETRQLAITPTARIAPTNEFSIRVVRVIRVIEVIRVMRVIRFIRVIRVIRVIKEVSGIVSRCR
jgi:hypothetical protein